MPRTYTESADNEAAQIHGNENRVRDSKNGVPGGNGGCIQHCHIIVKTQAVATAHVEENDFQSSETTTLVLKYVGGYLEA